MANRTDIDFMKMAYEYGSKWSTDPSIQNGCLLVDPSTKTVVSSGANHFPQGVREVDSRWERPIKYEFVEHAERNAIYSAARHGIKTKGLHIYCYWAACADCARAIIQCGITRLVTHKIIMDATPDRWKDTIVSAFTMMKEAGIKIDEVSDPIEGVEILFNGKLWMPV